MKWVIKLLISAAMVCMTIPAMAEGSCKPINGFKPKDDQCVRDGKTYLAPRHDGSDTVLLASRDQAFASCKARDMAVASLEQYREFFKAGGFEAMDLPIDELYWAASSSKDALMSFPGHEALLAVDPKIEGSVLCIRGGMNPISGMKFIPITGQPFSMQETEVTRGQWKALMGYYPEEDDTSCKPTVLSDDHPVSCVSATDAERFADEMTRKNDGHTYRLPSEQEWAAAAGDIEGPLYGWCSINSRERTHPVKKLKARNGLYDMVGNVFEWTSSNWDSSSSNRVVRGGDWLNWQEYCRASNRHYWGPDYRCSGVGFRLLRQP